MQVSLLGLSQESHKFIEPAMSLGLSRRSSDRKSGFPLASTSCRSMDIEPAAVVAAQPALRMPQKVSVLQARAMTVARVEGAIIRAVAAAQAGQAVQIPPRVATASFVRS